MPWRHAITRAVDGHRAPAPVPCPPSSREPGSPHLRATWDPELPADGDQTPPQPHARAQCRLHRCGDPNACGAASAPRPDQRGGSDTTLSRQLLPCPTATQSEYDCYRSRRTRLGSRRGVNVSLIAVLSASLTTAAICPQCPLTRRLSGTTEILGLS